MRILLIIYVHIFNALLLCHHVYIRIHKPNLIEKKFNLGIVKEYSFLLII